VSIASFWPLCREVVLEGKGERFMTGRAPAREDLTYDCIIVGAGPGGLQAAIHLGRYNRKVLLIDRGDGRTSHAKEIENFLGHPAISGREMVRIGKAQALCFGVYLEKGVVTEVEKTDRFSVRTRAGKTFYSAFLIAASGGRDNLLPIGNLEHFFGTGFYTCIDCDGYRTTGKKLIILGNGINTVRLAFGVKEMYTKDITLVLVIYEPSEDVKELLETESIPLVKGRPKRIVGDDRMEGLELTDGRTLPCEAILSDFGSKLNDDYLKGLPLKKDNRDFKYEVNHHFESSVDGLYILGPLNTGNDQAVIAAGQGATAAIDIKKRLLDI
jgi:thioredoxin reductase (NADPH)